MSDDDDMRGWELWEAWRVTKPWLSVPVSKPVKQPDAIDLELRAVQADELIDRLYAESNPGPNIEKRWRAAFAQRKRAYAQVPPPPDIPERVWRRLPCCLLCDRRILPGEPKEALSDGPPTKAKAVRRRWAHTACLDEVVTIRFTGVGDDDTAYFTT